MKVSVVIPTFNRPQHLDKLLQSLCQQDFKDFEVIIIDDASSDSNLEVINKYSKLLTLSYTRLEIGRGAPHCRNLGISKAQSELIALVDDDDYWAPRKLKLQVERMDACGPDVGLCYTWTNVVDENENLLREMYSEKQGNITADILKECFVPSPSVMVRKQALSIIGGFDETLPSCQDWETWIRLSLAGFQFTVVPEAVTYYIKHSGPTIGMSPRAKDGYRMLYKKHFWTLLRYMKIRHLIRYFRLTVKI